MKLTYLSILISVFVVVFPALGHAYCTQADAAGRWQVYSLASDGATTECGIVINSYGNMAKSTCTQYYNYQIAYTPLSGGTINLKDAAQCLYKGTFVFGGLKLVIRHLTLSKDKTTAQGIGTDPRGFAFMFNFTKK